MSGLDADLAELATAFGIATEFWDWQGRHIEVGAATVTAVLAALGVDAGSPEAANAALENRRTEPWRRMLPPCVVLRRERGGSVDVHVRHGERVDVWIELEGGGYGPTLEQRENWNGPQTIDGALVGEATYALPEGLPLGYHRLRAWSAGQEAVATLIVTPSWLGLPERVSDRRNWGVATQLYSVTSKQSWGTGDLVDLADLAGWAAGTHRAGFVLVNPLHAAEPVAPMEPSPYLPTSRRFANPLYLRPERIAEYADLSASDRATVDRLRSVLLTSLAGQDRIDRDASWTAKLAALRLIHAVPRTAGRDLAYATFCRRQGAGLDDFATWCALSVVHGSDWHGWHPDLQRPTSPQVQSFRTEHADEVDLYRWMQWVLDEQLGAAQAAAVRSGAGLGIVHDLAVGVHPRGADSWRLQDTFAQGVHVGAPPDAYNQNGQDWNQPPWRPDRLAATAYAPFRDMVATVLRSAGGLRVDHIIGLFRLWWIPEDLGPTEGTYVRYDHDALIGILALEAHRADAVVIGEDLGTVEPWVRDYLRERGILGTSILWFEFAFDTPGQPPLPPERWREYCLASVTTHDLPPTAGYLAGDHVRLRHELGLLTRTLADELAADEAERTAWLHDLEGRGALSHSAAAAAEQALDPDVPAAPADDVEATVLALHRFLTWTPSKLLAVALTDLIGDRRTQNQPGTIDEYPNWRVPLTGPDGRPMGLEQILTSERAARLAAVVNS